VESSAKEYLTCPELAAYLKLSVGTVRNWVHKDKVPYLKVNGAVRFDRAKIDAWMSGRQEREVS